MTHADRARAATPPDPPDLRAARIAAAQEGRISVAQLRAAGLDRGAVAHRVRKGQLHRVHVGVYAVGHPGTNMDARFWAAVLAGGDGTLLCDWASASLWGFARWDGRDVDVTAPGGGSRHRPGIRFHRSRCIDARDTTRRRGIPTTTAARALLEIAPQLSDRRLTRAVRQAQVERVTSTRQIAEMLGRANGHRAVRRIAAIIATGPAPTASGDEDAVLDLLLAHGLEHPVVNQSLVVAGHSYVPDLRWPTQRVILEIDSAWHDDPLSQRLDAERQADLQAAGERVVRTRREHALADPRRLVRRLVAAGAPYTDRQR